MSSDWREAEKLRHLVGGHDPQPKQETAREIADAVDRKSMGELAAAAIADIESEKARRKYSTDERPELVRVRTRIERFALAVLVLTLAGIVGFRLFRQPPPIVVGDPIAFIAVLAPAAVAKPTLDPEWSIPRGASDSLSERGRAVRIGALLVEFERANVRGDSTAQVFADAISALLSDVPDGGTDVATIFASADGSARTAEARHALAPFVRAAPMALGGWVQAARVAAASGDVGFFASQESRGGLAQLLALKGFPPEVEAARDRLDTLLHRRGRPDFSAVSDALEVIQRELAN